MVKNVKSDLRTFAEYVSPEVKTLVFHVEGVLCQSVGGGHDDFGDGGSYDI